MFTSCDQPDLNPLVLAAALALGSQGDDGPRGFRFRRPLLLRRNRGKMGEPVCARAILSGTCVCWGRPSNWLANGQRSCGVRRLVCCRAVFGGCT